MDLKPLKMILYVVNRYTKTMYEDNKNVKVQQ